MKTAHLKKHDTVYCSDKTTIELMDNSNSNMRLARYVSTQQLFYVSIHEFIACVTPTQHIPINFTPKQQQYIDLVSI